MTSMTRLANKGNKAASKRLHDQAHGDISVAWVFHYGAVDIDPKHLVVWVMLNGDPDAIPAWWAPADKPTGQYPDDLEQWLTDLRDQVRACYADVGWPDPDHLDILFDSDTRVEQGGGWHYFK